MSELKSDEFRGPALLEEPYYVFHLSEFKVYKILRESKRYLYWDNENEKNRLNARMKMFKRDTYEECWNDLLDIKAGIIKKEFKEIQEKYLDYTDFKNTYPERFLA